MGATPLVPGDPLQLGGYWLAGRLGAGGQGVVYEAYDVEGTRVAVKAFYGDFVSGGLRETLAKEVHTARRVASFCTAQVLAADLEAAQPYVVSEYVAGSDLQKAVIEGGPYRPDELHRLAIGVATALAAIHRAGVVHRDLKPANVLLGPDGPRVIDFGVARTEEMTRSHTGAVKGTPRYMAPELFAGGRADTASDVWAWGGVVLFAALGKVPFEGDSLPALMNSVVNTSPAVGVLDEPLRSVVAAALSKDPADRPSSQELLISLVGGAADTGLLLAEGSRAAAGVKQRGQTETTSFAESAESVFGRLDRPAQEAVPQVLLRMVMPGEGAEDTLRKARLEEFIDSPPAQRAVDAYVAAGLLVPDQGTVAIASPALLRAWPRLREWADAEREGLAVHHSLSEAARLWDDHGRKKSDLYQGTPLRRALQWAAAHRVHLNLNGLERAFLDEGEGLVRQRARLRNLLTGALAVMLLVAVGAVVLVVQQRQEATRQRDASVSLQASAQSHTLRRTDPRTGRRLAVAAGALNGGAQSHEAMLSALNQWEDDVFMVPGIDRRATVVTLGPDARTVAAQGPSGGRQWDAQTHKQLRGLPQGHKARTSQTAIGLSPDGRTAAHWVKTPPGSKEPDAGRVFDLATGRAIGPDLGKELLRFRFSHSGNLLLADPGTSALDAQGRPYASDRRLTRMVLWDVRRGRALLEFKANLIEWAVSADDRYLAISTDKGFELWDIAASKKVAAPWMARLTGGQPIQKLAFGPSGQTLAVSVGPALTLVDLADPTKARRLPSPPYKAAASNGFSWPDLPVFSADGRFVAVGFTLWDVNSPLRPLMDWRLPNEKPTDCRFTTDNRRLRCATDLGQVVSVDITRYTDRSAFPAPTTGTLQFDGAALSGDGGLAALATHEAISFWDVRKRRPLPGKLPMERPFIDNVITPMRLSRDGRLLALVTEAPDVRLELWATRTQQKLKTFTLPPPDPAARPLGRQRWDPAFAPDEKSVVALIGDQRDARLHVWDMASGRLTRSLPGKSESGLVFHQNGGVVAMGGAGLLEFPSGKAVTEPVPWLSKVKALSPDGRTALGVSSGGEVGFWDLKAQRQTSSGLGDLMDRGPRDPMPSDKSTAAAFSPDGRLLATGDGEGKVRLWDVASQRRFALDLFGHTAEVQSVVFSADGEALHSVGLDGTIRTNAISPARVMAELCAKVGALTEAEWNRYLQNAPYRRGCQ